MKSSGNKEISAEEKSMLKLKKPAMNRIEQGMLNIKNMRDNVADSRPLKEI